MAISVFGTPDICVLAKVLTWNTAIPLNRCMGGPRGFCRRDAVGQDVRGVPPHVAHVPRPEHGPAGTLSLLARCVVTLLAAAGGAPKPFSSPSIAPPPVRLTVN
jgi:hypothetical protein